jgi:hypothetical protein
VKDCLRLTGVQVGVVRSLNDVRVRMNDIRVRMNDVRVRMNDVRVRWRVDRVRRVGVGVLAELSVVTPPGVLVVRSSHD